MSAKVAEACSIVDTRIAALVGENCGRKLRGFGSNRDSEYSFCVFCLPDVRNCAEVRFEYDRYPSQSRISS